MGAYPPSRQRRGRSDRYLLHSRIADEIVRDAAVLPSDHVIEIGAGTGRLTRPLASVAGHVTAIEIDPAMAEHLRRTFGEHRNVAVVHADALEFAFPQTPWRALGNLPFSKTTAILRRLLDDPATHLERADLLVQFEIARKRAGARPATLVSLSWLPWWDFSFPRAIPAMAFDPVPSVDAGLLVVRRRSAELLDRSDRPAFVALLARAFALGGWPLRRSIASKIAPRAWRRIARERGLDMDARPADLDVWDWVAVFGATRPPPQGTAVRTKRSGRS